MKGDFMQTFGNYLKQLRNKKNLTQKELARLAGIDPSTLCRLEQGSRKPTPRMVRKLARALEQPLAELMARAEMKQIAENLPVFAERLHSLRKLSGLTQEQLAEILDCRKSVLAGCESGRRPPGYLLSLKIASYFNVSLDYLFGLTEGNKDGNQAGLTVEQEVVLSILKNLPWLTCKT
ncbi:helix-turn-helix domain-containing protein [Desulfoscipio geothermicus]|uniref:Transcriptional regulator, contains XRE-family HTH domain n=1 Tax=Desulfoscipio geothermicus DSM 3669 TaxID=1121426 RepID=A0A1I6D249_9FIRM|nr:helix-turn-helix transcriptional regulator [Desulfoscipio geothermicus]SFQ99576.1 Transcriptional regulator, contains XRE-family HTH domain [Desulfoscipio geothermicus DSM 3669]